MVAAVIGGAHLVPTAVAGGDKVGDKRVEARRIAGELDRLQRQESVLGEAFDQAQLTLSDLRQRVGVDQRQVAITGREVARRRNDLSRYAVAAYTANSDEPLQIAMNGSGTDLGQRQTYESVTAGNQADLIDALKAATSDQRAAAEQLGRAQDGAAKARVDLDRKREVVTSLVSEQRGILDRVQGQLKALVAQAEAQRAAAAASAIHAAAVRAAAKALAAAPPTPPKPARPRTPIVPSPQPSSSDRPAALRATAPRPTGNHRSIPTRPANAPEVTKTSAPPPVTPTLPVPTTQPVTSPVPTRSPAPPPALSPNGGGTAPAASGDVIRWAETRLGSPYVWGAAGPNAFDCSGLVLWSFAQSGRGGLPHSSQAMYAMSLHLSLSALRPGDLVFFGQPVHHVGIYIGGGNMIDALNSRTPVAIHSIYGISETPLAGRI